MQSVEHLEGKDGMKKEGVNRGRGGAGAGGEGGGIASGLEIKNALETSPQIHFSY